MGSGFEWSTTAPESQGMSSARLDALCSDLAERNTKAFLVVRNDRIVYEWYAADHGAEKPHYTASLAKAIVGGMSLTLALQDGRLAVDDPAWSYIPAWKDDPEKAKISIRHLATHSSGIEDAEKDGLPHEELPGWKGAFWKRDPDPFSIARDRAPVIFEPGTEYAYSNPGMAMLAWAVTASLQGCEHADIRTLLRERIMEPIGVLEEEWLIGYGKGYELDGLELYANWGGGSYTARAVARIGRLMLRQGDWEGRQLIDPEWVKKVVAYADTPLPPRTGGDPQPGSGLCWWTNSDEVWKSVPPDAFAGAGAGHQLLLVVPSLDLIVVRNGGSLEEVSWRSGFWSAVTKYLFDPLMEAVVAEKNGSAEGPYPPSPVIAAVNWAPAESVRREARGKGKDGSDNWPLTWGDDGELYTAYGDGYGFDPIVPEKLGLGFARVIGGPEDFRGENIRSDGENSGMGPKGKKASGLLMVDGVLYMWVRNVDGEGNYSQLAWSSDRGRSWTWSEWLFEEFGYATFVNFGPNYTGVPEELGDYVYGVSHDGPSAYEPADRFALMRVRKHLIRERDAYEFFAALDADGRPLWSKDIGMRGAVFEHPGSCLRSGISYNAGLKRYLWWQGLRKADARFQGGFGLYDAPQPWGPWTTVYFTRRWDVGPGEAGCLPTRWMSADGKRCYLVFSGNDNFAVRQVDFSVRAD